MGGCWGGSFSKQQVLAIFFVLLFFGGGGVGRTNDDADVGSDAVWVI